MLARSARYAAGMLALSLVVASAGAAQPGAPPRDGLNQALLGALASRIPQLELSRIDLLASGLAPNHQEVVRVDKQIAALRQELARLPDQRTAQMQVARNFLQSVESRLADLVINRALLVATGVPATNPSLQQMVAAEALLSGRRVELIRMLSGT